MAMVYTLAQTNLSSLSAGVYRLSDILKVDQEFSDLPADWTRIGAYAEVHFNSNGDDIALSARPSETAADTYFIRLRGDDGDGSYEDFSKTTMSLGTSFVDKYSDGNDATKWDWALPYHITSITVVTLFRNGSGGLEYELSAVDTIGHRGYNIKASSIELKQIKLRDIDDGGLNFLSVSSNNPYFDGRTLVNGVVKITGDSADSISSMSLQVIQRGDHVATMKLSSAAREKLLGVNFGDDDTLRFNASGKTPLFQLTNKEASKIDISKNGSLAFKLVAESDGGEIIEHRIPGAVDILYLYKNPKNFTGPDQREGGDNWILPDTFDFLDHYAKKGVRYGDMSNMNGGHFIQHAEHRIGTSIDAHFRDYNDLDGDTAKKMIKLLNDGYGKHVEEVFVTFVKGSEFHQEIKGVTLSDGRKATDVIRIASDHDTHFHWEVII